MIAPDWRRLAVMAMGPLGWTPGVFWAATPGELLMTVEGRFPGLVTDNVHSEALTGHELATLAAKFPDR